MPWVFYFREGTFTVFNQWCRHVKKLCFYCAINTRDKEVPALPNIDVNNWGPYQYNSKRKKLQWELMTTWTDFERAMHARYDSGVFGYLC